WLYLLSEVSLPFMVCSTILSYRRLMAQALRLNGLSPLTSICMPNIVLKSAFPDGNTSLNVAHINADGLRPKIDEFRKVIKGVNLHCVAISETHFKSYITSKSVELEGYRLLRNDRPVRRKGGVALYVKKSLHARIVSESASSRLLLEKVSFSWDNDGEEILKSIDMKVNNGELVAIVGSVGSGKSSLLSAVLGEMSKLSGRVHVVGKTAYVSQQAWIQNCTLRANILFGKPFDEKRYQSVIAACALEMDIGMLPAGDQTEIGEKGINLSGGQKQRISLARAVYHEADIYLLDDPLSAVDAHVGQHIFECVIGPTGLLANKTRIVVTHAVNYLPKVDKIFVLKDGTITESGDYITLLKRGGAFAEFLLEFVRDAVQDANDDEHFESQIADDTLLLERLSSRISESSQKENVVQLLRQSSESSAKNVPSESVRIQDRLIDEEELRVGSVKFEVYEHYVKSVGVKWMIFMLLANAVFQGFSIGSNMWLSRWSTDSNAGSDTHLRDTYLGVYGAFGLFMCISGFLLDLAPRLGGLVAGLRLHQTLLHGILRAPLSFFETTPTGRILSRFASDIDGIDNTLPQMLSGAFGMGFEVLATVVVISISTSWFLIAVIPIAFLYYMLQRIYIAASRQLKRLSSVTRSPIYSHFGETLQGAHTIRAFAAQKRFIEESDERVDWNQASQFANIVANRWLGIRLEIVGTLIILFAALFAVLNRDVVSSGIAGLSIAYALQITKTLNWLVRTISVVETEAVSVERVKEYSQIKSEAPWNVPSQKLANNWPEVGTVEFNDFELRYRDGLDLTLKGLSFKIDGSEKVGIVGRTGAGKSSLTLALFRIIESAGGSIVIDGQDISKLGLHDLRSRLTIIPQDPVLFSGTLRLNLDPFEQNSDEELWTALEHAHLKAFVQELTAGLNHEITEGGENLSVGQRQLICLARALLRKTKILILDEATAAIDLETDDLIQKTIRKEFNDCTILTIAHRLNTIMDSDKVIVLDQGKVLEFGSPKELLQNEMSTFYGMAKESGLNTNLTWHTNDPDLTVCFQRTVLVWAPCLFLWIFLWLDVVRIKRAMNRDIPWGALNLSKLAFTVALIALTAVEFYIVLLHANAGGNIYPVDFYTPLIKIASFMLSGTLVYLNRKNGLQSSGLLFLFWFFLFLFSIPQCRSEFRDRTIGKENLIENYWDDYRFVSFMLFFAMTTIVFLLNCFVDKEPSYTKYPNTKNPCPEANSNFLSKLFFAWFDKMAWKGFKAPLTTTDLWDLQAENKAIEIVPAFAKHWKNAENASSVQTNKKNSVKKERRKVSILPALWKTFGGSLFFAWMLKVGYDVITFMLPQLLGLTIGFVDASKGDNRPELWKGILYASLLFIVATVQTVIFNQFFHRMYIIGFRIRTALINAIYCKSLRVSNAARKESTIGEITNLMSIDANRFTEIMLSIDLVWSAPFQISLAMYFLWSMLGPAVLAGLAVMLISMPITGLLLNVIRKYYTKQMANKDERIKMMNEILNGVKVLKLYAWENSFEGIVSNIRQKEVNTLRKSAYLGSLTNLIWFIVPYLVSLFTFGVFVLIDERNVLTPQIAFVSLNLFNIIRFPLVLLPDLVSNLIQTRVSITRIDKFLNSDELDEDSIEHSDEKG
ncbi:Multidrug resistance-associated protein 1, partial [Pseudolycoriella hygida]